jgi:hypothetical protein
MTPEERIDAVWTLTKACMGWNSEGADEHRLRKEVVRITRRRPWVSESRCAADLSANRSASR